MDDKTRPNHAGLIPAFDENWFNDSSADYSSIYTINPKNVIWVNMLKGEMEWEGNHYTKFNVKFIDGSERQLWFDDDSRKVLFSGRTQK